jgi:hypothetical protein
MIPIRDDQPRFSTPYITYFLIALNTAVYLFGLAVQAQGGRAYAAFMYEFGVVPRNVTDLVGAGSQVTILGTLLPFFTSMFVHGGFQHLLGNMWVLWIFGDNIEDYLGHFNYLIFYLVSGLAASASHVLLNAHSSMPTVGASGAIAGVMGAYFVLYPRARVLTWFVFIFYMPAWIVLGYWFLVQFLSGAATSIANQTSGGIAVWAHVGGFVAGIVLIKVFSERPRLYRYGTW